LSCAPIALTRASFCSSFPSPAISPPASMIGCAAAPASSFH
jgi:hypothetical protein